jgi:hypothetical protein
MTGRRSYTLAEVVVSAAVVGIMLVAGLHAAVGARLTRQHTDHQAEGVLLAHDLLTEILRLAYEDPDETPVFGPEPSEVDGTRKAFDDVDDYHHWVENFLTYKDGTTIPARVGWARSVAVAAVDPLTLNLDPAPVPKLPPVLELGGTAALEANQAVVVEEVNGVALDTGVKCVTVTVYHGGAQVAQLAALRTAAGVKAVLQPDVLAKPEDPADASAVKNVDDVTLKLAK